MSFPIWVLFFPVLICSYHLVAAQKDFWGHYCGITGNYTENSDYKRNLDDALDSLTGKNNGYGFYKSTSAQVNAAALCRGDIQPERCRGCVDDATRELRQVCPNQIEAVGWYDPCFLRYSDRPMSNNISIPLINWSNVSDSEYDEWKETVKNLLGTLRSEAPGGGQLRKYASGDTRTPGLLSIYGMMQCVPDLTVTECDDCLVGATGVLQKYDRSLGARVGMTSCLIRYETIMFLDSTWYPDSENKEGTNNGDIIGQGTNNGAILGPVVVVVAITAVVLFVFYRRHQKRKRQGLLSPESSVGFSNTIIGQQEPNQESNLRPTRDRRNPTHLNDFDDGLNIQPGQRPTRDKRNSAHLKDFDDGPNIQPGQRPTRDKRNSTHLKDFDDGPNIQPEQRLTIA